MNINYYPGLRFHLNQYLKTLSSSTKKNKISIYSSSPRNKFKYLKGQSYNFVPMPLKIITRILKSNYGPYFKTIDFEIYQYLANIYHKKIDNEINHCWATFAFHIFKKFEKSIKILERSCPHIITQIDLLQNQYDRLNLKYLKPTNYSIDRQLAEYDMADQIVVPSEFTRKTFIKRGISNNKIKVVNLNSNSNIDYCYKEKNVDKLIFGYCGGAIIRKGLPHLLEAWLQQPENHNKELWLRVNKNNLNILPKLKNKLLLRKDIKFIEYKLDMTEFYNSIDVLMHPAVEEGFGMVVIEAVTAGVPVILSESVGAKDVLKKGDYILLSDVSKEDIFSFFNIPNDIMKSLINNIKLNHDYYKNNIQSQNKITDVYENILTNGK